MDDKLAYKQCRQGRRGRDPGLPGGLIRRRSQLNRPIAKG
jgi:hypothetical protein